VDPQDKNERVVKEQVALRSHDRAALFSLLPNLRSRAADHVTGSSVNVLIPLPSTINMQQLLYRVITFPQTMFETVVLTFEPVPNALLKLLLPRTR
jgi:hypothetical protein